MNLKEKLKSTFENPSENIGSVGQTIIGFLGVSLITVVLKFIGSFVIPTMSHPNTLAAFFAETMLGLLVSLLVVLMGIALFMICRSLGEVIVEDCLD